MCDAEGGAMSRRVKIIYADGEKTYGDVDVSGEKPIIITGGMPYDLESFAATGATVAVNDQATLKLLQESGVKARPTGKQTTITISVTEQLRERLTVASKEFGRTTTSILVEAAEKWLQDKEM